MAHNYHVSVSGSDTWAGSAQRPLRTIQRAADLARPGDTVTIHEGVYREHVNPVRGGTGDTERILYTAAPGEKPVISGAERVSDWERIGDGVYRTVLPNTMFGDFNPYKETVGGDWFRSLERDFHLGEVYINGKSMFEVSTLDEVMDPKPSRRRVNRNGRCTHGAAGRTRTPPRSMPGSASSIPHGRTSRSTCVDSASGRRRPESTTSRCVDCT